MCHKKGRILLIGTGYMACEYAKVLASLPIEFIVVGRSEKGVSDFKDTTGISAVSGGIETYLQFHDIKDISSAIVAANVIKLENITKLLLKFGVKNILIEKPAGFNKEEIKTLANLSKKNSASLYVAYNRRHYAPIENVLELIKEDGGVLSFNFEFTEWSHVIRDLPHQQELKDIWLLLNSTHVIDLAFFVGGYPKEMTSFSAGNLDWAKGSAIHAGAGVSETGALFSYNANWVAPGRWGVEWLTSHHRLILRPLEKLQIQVLGSVNAEFVDLDDELDINFKPGLYKQVSGFLGFNTKAKSKLKTISEQLDMMDIYEKIANQRYE